MMIGKIKRLDLWTYKLNLLLKIPFFLWFLKQIIYLKKKKYFTGIMTVFFFPNGLLT